MAEGGRFELEETAGFTAWIERLHDGAARVAVAERLRRFRLGLFGDVKPVGGRVWEARVDVGPGYRVYYIRSGRRLILLLCGGNKASQARDIARARAMVAEMD